MIMDTRIRYWWLWIPVVFALSSAPAEAQLSPFWSAEVLLDLHELGAIVDLNNANQALGVNFVWNMDDGTLTGLGSLGGGNTVAKDINNLGHVVGLSRDASGALVGFLWDPVNGMRDLSVLVGVELFPTA